jgi:hypothetical protein
LVAVPGSVPRQGKEMVNWLLSPVRFRPGFPRFPRPRFPTTRSGLRDYLVQRRSTYPVYIADAGALKRLKVVSTPSTVVVERDGRVQRVLVGAYRGEVAKELESAFGVVLPAVAGS